MADLLTELEPPAIAPGDNPPPAATPVPVTHPDDDDDWFTREDVIVEFQQAVRIYRNPRNHVVIRQEARDMHEDDGLVFLATDEAIKAVISALQRELREGRHG